MGVGLGLCVCVWCGGGYLRAEAEDTRNSCLVLNGYRVVVGEAEPEEDKEADSADGYEDL